MSIYHNIKRIAERKKIQQKDIAEKLDVRPNTVNNWFNSNTSMKAELVPEIASLLGVSIEELYSEKTDYEIHNKTNKPAPPRNPNDLCNDPNCIKRIRELEDDKAQLKEHIKLLQELLQKGGQPPGEIKGGVEKHLSGTG